MADNKTKATDASVEGFLESVSEKRRQEARQLIALMGEISGEEAVLWGPSIIGFGTQQYRYDSGREGDMPRLGFSPRKASLTVYFSEGFDRYGEALARLGKHTSSVSCLYIPHLDQVDLAVLREMLETSYGLGDEPPHKPETVDDYIRSIPAAARPAFDKLRSLVQAQLPTARETLSYGILGYAQSTKTPRVFISGWKDHLSIYPVPRDPALQTELKPWMRGKGTLWFPLDQPLPEELIRRIVEALI